MTAKDVSGADGVKIGIHKIEEVHWTPKRWLQSFNDTAQPQRHGSRKKPPPSR